MWKVYLLMTKAKRIITHCPVLPFVFLCLSAHFFGFHQQQTAGFNKKALYSAFQKEISNIPLFQLLQCESFLALHHSKVNIFTFWTVNQTKQDTYRHHFALSQTVLPLFLTFTRPKNQWQLKLIQLRNIPSIYQVKITVNCSPKHYTLYIHSSSQAAYSIWYCLCSHPMVNLVFQKD